MTPSWCWPPASHSGRPTVLFGDVADGAWQTTIDFLKERGLLPGTTEVKVDEIWSDDYLPED